MTALRNFGVLAAALIVGILVMQPVRFFTMDLTSGEWTNLAGEILLRLIHLLPALVAAGVVGVLCGMLIKTTQRTAWAIALGLIVILLRGSTTRYIVDEASEWIKIGIELMLIGAVAAIAFLIASRVRRDFVPAT